MAKETKLQVSLKGFQQTVAAIAAVKKTLIPDELNAQMLKVLIGAKGAKGGLVQVTKKASAETIRADMSRHVGKIPMSRALAIKALKKTGAKFTPAQIDALEEKIIAARVRSRAFMAASWLFSAFDLARSVKGANLTRANSVPLTTEARREGKKANDADSSPAKPGKDRCTIYNTADGAARVATGPIPRALNNARLDMIKYLGRKFGEQVAKKKGAS